MSTKKKIDENKQKSSQNVSPTSQKREAESNASSEALKRWSGVRSSFRTHKKSNIMRVFLPNKGKDVDLGNLPKNTTQDVTVNQPSTSQQSGNGQTTNDQQSGDAADQQSDNDQNPIDQQSNDDTAQEREEGSVFVAQSDFAQSFFQTTQRLQSTNPIFFDVEGLGDSITIKIPGTTDNTFASIVRNLQTSENKQLAKDITVIETNNIDAVVGPAVANQIIHLIGTLEFQLLDSVTNKGVLPFNEQRKIKTSSRKTKVLTRTKLHLESKKATIAKAYQYHSTQNQVEMVLVSTILMSITQTFIDLISFSLGDVPETRTNLMTQPSFRFWEILESRRKTNTLNQTVVETLFIAILGLIRKSDDAWVKEGDFETLFMRLANYVAIPLVCVRPGEHTYESYVMNEGKVITENEELANLKSNHVFDDNESIHFGSPFSSALCVKEWTKNEFKSLRKKNHNLCSAVGSVLSIKNTRAKFESTIAKLNNFLSDAKEYSENFDGCGTIRERESLNSLVNRINTALSKARNSKIFRCDVSKTTSDDDLVNHILSVFTDFDADDEDEYGCGDEAHNIDNDADFFELIQKYETTKNRIFSVRQQIPKGQIGLACRLGNETLTNLAVVDGNEAFILKDLSKMVKGVVMKQILSQRAGLSEFEGHGNFLTPKLFEFPSARFRKEMKKYIVCLVTVMRHGGKLAYDVLQESLNRTQFGRDVLRQIQRDYQFLQSFLNKTSFFEYTSSLAMASQDNNVKKMKHIINLVAESVEKAEEDQNASITINPTLDQTHTLSMGSYLSCFLDRLDKGSAALSRDDTAEPLENEAIFLELTDALSVEKKATKVWAQTIKLVGRQIEVKNFISHYAEIIACVVAFALSNTKDVPTIRAKMEIVGILEEEIVDLIKQLTKSFRENNHVIVSAPVSIMALREMACSDKTKFSKVMEDLDDILFPNTPFAAAKKSPADPPDDEGCCDSSTECRDADFFKGELQKLAHLKNKHQVMFFASLIKPSRKITGGNTFENEVNDSKAIRDFSSEPSNFVTLDQGNRSVSLLIGAKQQGKLISSTIRNFSERFPYPLGDNFSDIDVATVFGYPATSSPKTAIVNEHSVLAPLISRLRETVNQVNGRTREFINNTERIANVVNAYSENDDLKRISDSILSILKNNNFERNAKKPRSFYEDDENWDCASDDGSMDVDEDVIDNEYFIKYLHKSSDEEEDEEILQRSKGGTDWNKRTRRLAQRSCVLISNRRNYGSVSVRKIIQNKQTQLKDLMNLAKQLLETVMKRTKQFESSESYDLDQYLLNVLDILDRELDIFTLNASLFNLKSLVFLQKIDRPNQIEGINENYITINRRLIALLGDTEMYSKVISPEVAECLQPEQVIETLIGNYVQSGGYLFSALIDKIKFSGVVQNGTALKRLQELRHLTRRLDRKISVSRIIRDSVSTQPPSKKRLKFKRSVNVFLGERGEKRRHLEQIFDSDLSSEEDEESSSSSSSSSNTTTSSSELNSSPSSDDSDAASRLIGRESDARAFDKKNPLFGDISNKIKNLFRKKKNITFQKVEKIVLENQQFYDTFITYMFGLLVKDENKWIKTIINGLNIDNIKKVSHGLEDIGRIVYSNTNLLWNDYVPSKIESYDAFSPPKPPDDSPAADDEDQQLTPTTYLDLLFMRAAALVKDFDNSLIYRLDKALRTKKWLEKDIGYLERGLIECVPSQIRKASDIETLYSKRFDFVGALINLSDPTAFVNTRKNTVDMLNVVILAQRLNFDDNLSFDMNAKSEAVNVKCCSDVSMKSMLSNKYRPSGSRTSEPNDLLNSNIESMVSGNCFEPNNIPVWGAIDLSSEVNSIDCLTATSLSRRRPSKIFAKYAEQRGLIDFFTKGTPLGPLLSDKKNVMVHQYFKDRMEWKHLPEPNFILESAAMNAFGDFDTLVSFGRGGIPASTGSDSPKIKFVNSIKDIVSQLCYIKTNLETSDTAPLLCGLVDSPSSSELHKRLRNLLADMRINFTYCETLKSMADRIGSVTNDMARILSFIDHDFGEKTVNKIVSKYILCFGPNAKPEDVSASLKTDVLSVYKESMNLLRSIVDTINLTNRVLEMQRKRLELCLSDNKVSEIWGGTNIVQNIQEWGLDGSYYPLAAASAMDRQQRCTDHVLNAFKILLTESIRASVAEDAFKRTTAISLRTASAPECRKTFFAASSIGTPSTPPFAVLHGGDAAVNEKSRRHRMPLPFNVDTIEFNLGNNLIELSSLSLYLTANARAIFNQFAGLSGTVPVLTAADNNATPVAVASPVIKVLDDLMNDLDEAMERLRLLKSPDSSSLASKFNSIHAEIVFKKGKLERATENLEKSSQIMRTREFRKLLSRYLTAINETYPDLISKLKIQANALLQKKRSVDIDNSNKRLKENIDKIEDTYVTTKVNLEAKQLEYLERLNQVNSEISIGQLNYRISTEDHYNDDGGQDPETRKKLIANNIALAEQLKTLDNEKNYLENKLQEANRGFKELEEHKRNAIKNSRLEIETICQKYDDAFFQLCQASLDIYNNASRLDTSAELETLAERLKATEEDECVAATVTTVKGTAFSSFQCFLQDVHGMESELGETRRSSVENPSKIVPSICESCMKLFFNLETRSVATKHAFNMESASKVDQVRGVIESVLAYGNKEALDELAVHGTNAFLTKLSFETLRTCIVYTTQDPTEELRDKTVLLPFSELFACPGHDYVQFRAKLVKSCDSKLFGNVTHLSTLTSSIATMNPNVESIFFVPKDEKESFSSIRNVVLSSGELLSSSSDASLMSGSEFVGPSVLRAASSAREAVNTVTAPSLSPNEEAMKRASKVPGSGEFNLDLGTTMICARGVNLNKEIDRNFIDLQLNDMNKQLLNQQEQSIEESSINFGKRLVMSVAGMTGGAYQSDPMTIGKIQSIVMEHLGSKLKKPPNPFTFLDVMGTDRNFDCNYDLNELQASKNAGLLNNDPFFRIGAFKKFYNLNNRKGFSNLFKLNLDSVLEGGEPTLSGGGLSLSSKQDWVKEQMRQAKRPRLDEASSGANPSVGDDGGKTIPFKQLMGGFVSTIMATSSPLLTELRPELLSLKIKDVEPRQFSPESFMEALNLAPEKVKKHLNVIAKKFCSSLPAPSVYLERLIDHIDRSSSLMHSYLNPDNASYQTARSDIAHLLMRTNIFSKSLENSLKKDNPFFSNFSHVIQEALTASNGSSSTDIAQHLKSRLLPVLSEVPFFGQYLLLEKLNDLSGMTISDGFMQKLKTNLNFNSGIFSPKNELLTLTHLIGTQDSPLEIANDRVLTYFYLLKHMKNFATPSSDIPHLIANNTLLSLSSMNRDRSVHKNSPLVDTILACSTDKTSLLANINRFEKLFARINDSDRMTSQQVCACPFKDHHDHDRNVVSKYSRLVTGEKVRADPYGTQKLIAKSDYIRNLSRLKLSQSRTEFQKTLPILVKSGYGVTYKDSLILNQLALDSLMLSPAGVNLGCIVNPSNSGTVLASRTCFRSGTGACASDIKATAASRLNRSNLQAPSNSLEPSMYIQRGYLNPKLIAVTNALYANLLRAQEGLMADLKLKIEQTSFADILSEEAIVNMTTLNNQLKDLVSKNEASVATAAAAAEGEYRIKGGGNDQISSHQLRNLLCSGIENYKNLEYSGCQAPSQFGSGIPNLHYLTLDSSDEGKAARDIDILIDSSNQINPIENFLALSRDAKARDTSHHDDDEMVKLVSFIFDTIRQQLDPEQYAAITSAFSGGMGAQDNEITKIKNIIDAVEENSQNKEDITSFTQLSMFVMTFSKVIKPFLDAHKDTVKKIFRISSVIVHLNNLLKFGMSNSTSYDLSHLGATRDLPIEESVVYQTVHPMISLAYYKAAALLYVKEIETKHRIIAQRQVPIAFLNHPDTATIRNNCELVAGRGGGAGTMGSNVATLLQCFSFLYSLNLSTLQPNETIGIPNLQCSANESDFRRRNSTAVNDNRSPFLTIPEHKKIQVSIPTDFSGLVTNVHQKGNEMFLWTDAVIPLMTQLALTDTTISKVASDVQLIPEIFYPTTEAFGGEKMSPKHAITEFRITDMERDKPVTSEIRDLTHVRAASPATSFLNNVVRKRSGEMFAEEKSVFKNSATILSEIERNLETLISSTIHGGGQREAMVSLALIQKVKSDLQVVSPIAECFAKWQSCCSASSSSTSSLEDFPIFGGSADSIENNHLNFNMIFRNFDKIYDETDNTTESRKMLLSSEREFKHYESDLRYKTQFLKKTVNYFKRLGWQMDPTSIEAIIGGNKKIFDKVNGLTKDNIHCPLNEDVGPGKRARLPTTPVNMNNTQSKILSMHSFLSGGR